MALKQSPIQVDPLALSTKTEHRFYCNGANFTDFILHLEVTLTLNLVLLQEATDRTFRTH